MLVCRSIKDSERRFKDAPTVLFSTLRARLAIHYSFLLLITYHLWRFQRQFGSVSDLNNIFITYPPLASKQIREK